MNYALLLAGNTVSTLGRSVYLITVMLWFQETLNNAAYLGILQTAALLPTALLAPIGGLASDRIGRVRVMVASDVIRGVLMIALSAVLFRLPPADSVLYVVLSSVVVGAGSAFFQPAVLSLLPDVVRPERLSAANGTRATVTQTANVAGTAMGGSLYALLGLPWAVAINGAAFVVSGLQEMLIREPARGSLAPGPTPGPPGPAGYDGVPRGGSLAPGQPGPAGYHGEPAPTPPAMEGRRRGILRELTAGIAFCVRNRRIGLAVGANAFLVMSTPPMILTVPFFVRDRLQLGPPAVAMVLAALLVGGTGGFVLHGVLRRGFRLGVDLTLGMAVLAAAAAVLGWLDLAVVATGRGQTVESFVPVVVAVVAAVGGSAIGWVYVAALNAVQRGTEASVRGRVFSIGEAAMGFGMPLAYVLTGPAVEALRPDVGLVFIAVACWVVLGWGVGAILWRKYPGNVSTTGARL